MKKVYFMLATAIFLSPICSAQVSAPEFYDKVFTKEMKSFTAKDTNGLALARIKNSSVCLDYGSHLKLFYLDGREVQYDRGFSKWLVFYIPNCQYVYCFSEKGEIKSIFYRIEGTEKDEIALTDSRELEEGTVEYDHALKKFYQAFPLLEKFKVN